METASNSTEIATLLHQLSLARNEINNLRQQLVSLKHCYRKDVEQIKESLKSWTCQKCSTNNEATSSTHTSIPEISEVREFPYKFIGYIETSFSNKRAVPRQPGILSQSQGIIRIDNGVLTNPQHALEGLEQFSHMWILFYFHQNESTHIHTKVTPPRLNGARVGVFATRSPHRPSPIGLSLVKVDSVQDECIFFSGVDMLDGTPVLDIKPFIPQYDSPYPAQLSVQPVCSSRQPHTSTSTLNWQRLPVDPDTRSEDGDLDLQDRLLIGESHSSGDNLDIPITSNSSSNPANLRILDGRDSDEVFVNPQELDTNPDSDGNYYDRSPARSSSQREAPEGSEGGSPPSPTVLGDIRVAGWITNAPVSRLNVQFADECLRKLRILMETQEDAAAIQTAIVAILSEDPRSVYIRERYGEDPYICTIQGFSVTCFFDDTSHVCLVTDVERIQASNAVMENSNTGT